MGIYDKDTVAEVSEGVKRMDIKTRLMLYAGLFLVWLGFGVIMPIEIKLRGVIERWMTRRAR